MAAAFKNVTDEQALEVLQELYFEIMLGLTDLEKMKVSTSDIIKEAIKLNQEWLDGGLSHSDAQELYDWVRYCASEKKLTEKVLFQDLRAHGAPRYWVDKLEQIVMQNLKKFRHPSKALCLRVAEIIKSKSH